MEQVSKEQKRWLFWRKIVFSYVLLTACFLSLAPFIFLATADLFSVMPIAAPAFNNKPYFNNVLLWAHVALALPALVIGPWLFIRQFREEHLKWHRYLGQVYIICCLLSAVTSLPLALANVAGVLPRVGFSSLAICWFLFTYVAYRKAREKKFTLHRAWMMRSYACVYAFVNVKIYALSIYFLDLETSRYFDQVLQSCFSWTTNLMVVEVYLAASTFTGSFAGRKIFLRQLRQLPVKMAGFLTAFGTFFLLSYYLFPMDQ